ncbi:MAG TPA: 1-phosphofructokinase family hexose kinase [Terriglobales bacterium]|nr:1-phosphofructokinase family hexose kinase [Terriglobales bacterium]
MIVAVSLNPAVDKYLRLPRLRRGEHLEALEAISSAGGKAINVAGVLRMLGEEVQLLGFFGGFTGQYILAEVAREGIQADPVLVAALTRTAFVLVEEDGSETEVVEPGAAVTPAEVAAVRAKVRAAAPQAAVVVLSGSVPPGCGDDIYVKLLADCGGHCPVLVDTSRAPLRTLLAAAPRPGPALIKPNRREAQAALGVSLDSAESISAALRQFRASGVAMPALSDGSAGLYVLIGDDVWLAESPALERVNSVGSGDAAVAGFAAGMARGSEPIHQLRLAAACGAANVLTKECAQVRADDVARLLPQISVRRL